jgi:hypothetical protein
MAGLPNKEENMRRYIGLLPTASVVLLLGLGVQPRQLHLEPKPKPLERQKWAFG